MLRDKKSVKSEKKSGDDDESGEQEDPKEPDEETLPPVDQLLWAKDILSGLSVQELKQAEHSTKFSIVISIVKKSMKLKENVLVFVHSIPSLDHLEGVLNKKGHRVFRLTGSTTPKDRQPMIDEFNKKEGVVFLISPKVVPSQF